MGGKERRHWSRSISTRHSNRHISSTASASAGCMGGLLHYFDFHHINLFNAAATGHATATATAPMSSDSLSTTSTHSDRSGVEAPRNSLDLEAPVQVQQLTDQAKTSSSSSSLLEDHYFDIPLVGVQSESAPAFDIFPPNIISHSSRKLPLLGDKQDRRVALSDTPETPRTPSLVARLMGIDGLPDPAPSPPATARQKKQLMTKNIELKKRELPSSSMKLQEISKKEPRQPLRNININCNARSRFSDVGCRSLPDTPRVSSARSSWDVDYARHSLQIQIHGENLNSGNSSNVNVAVGDYSLPPSPTQYYSMKPRRKYQDENRSPRSREYAKEIVKQMKETISNRRSESGREDTNVRSRRSSTIREVEKHDIDGSSRTKPALGSVSLSPPSPQPVSAPLTLSLSKTTELTTKAKLQDHIPNLHVLPKLVRVKPSRPPPPPPVAAAAGGTGNGKCNKGANERFTARFKKPASTSTSGSAGCLGTVSVTGDKSFSIAIEKSEIPPKLLIRSPQPQPQPQPQYFKKDESAIQPRRIGKSCRTRPDEELEYKYVRSILHRAGFMGGSHDARTSLAVDPIVFHQLEVELPVDDSRYHGSGLRYRWNRKHLFHLVEEMLRDLMDYPYNDAAAVAMRGGGTQELVGKVWSEIERMMIRSSRECEYLSDIDALVGVEMRERKIRELSRHGAVRKEAREIGVEMEEEILEELIGETAADLSSAISPDLLSLF